MRFVRAALGSAILCVSASGCMMEPRSNVAPVFRNPEHTVEVEVYSWKYLKQEHVVMQQRDYSCGSAAVATLVRYYWGDNVTEDDFLLPIINKLSPKELEDRQKNGLSITDLRLAAVNKGYQASIGRITMDKLVELKVPVVVRIKLNDQGHFVVFKGIVEDRIFLADPIRGNVRVSIDKFSQQWTDGAILVIAKPGAKLPENAPLKELPPEGLVRPEL
jgi:predicted double-glycine peptidase